MRDSKKSLVYLIIIGLIVSLFIGLRQSKVGRDTESYISHFNDAASIQNIDKFEIGFSYLIYFISKHTNSVEFFFFIIALIITIGYVKFFNNVYKKTLNLRSSSLGRYLIFFTILLFSSWYYALTMNGIRQGVSLVFLYLSLYQLFYENKKIKFIVFYLLAISFHHASIMMAPLLLFYKARFRIVFIAWTLLGLGYFTSTNELFIEWISTRFNLQIYKLVKYYAVERGEQPGDGLYYGFDIKFFIYTIFWPLLLLALTKWKSRLKSNDINNKEIMVLIKMYLFLSMPYFILGFGAYSNRYAVLCWFLIPVMQFYSISSLRFRYLFGRSAVLCLLIGFLFFCFVQLQWLNYL